MAKELPYPNALFFTDPAMWTYHRLTAGEPSVNLTDPTPVTPADLDLTVTPIARPDAWQFAAPPRAQRDPRHPDFTRFAPGGLVLPDDAAVTNALTVVQHASAIVQDHVHRSPLWLSEEASWRKFTIQRGTVGNWFVQRQSGTNLGLDFTQAVRDIAIKVALTYAVHFSADDTSDADPATTNPGWPTFTSHALGKLASNILAEQTFDAILANAQDLASYISIDPRSALASGLGGRSGPLYKDTPLLRFTGSAWDTIGQWKGFAQRNRVVQMSSAVTNWVLKPFFNLLHGARARIPGLWRVGNNDHRMMHMFKRRYESDISGFDTSVSRQLQVLLGWAFTKADPQLKQHIDTWLRVEDLALITPSWSLDHHTCAIEKFLGGTRSGVKTTAEAGTVYALIATLHALSKHGLDVEAWPYAKDFTVVIQGDDVLVATEIELSATTWSEAYAELGLKATLVEGDLFLSKHMSPAGGMAPVAGRIVQQTLSNEHEPIGELDVTVGILALGFIARTEGSHHLPLELQQLAASACKAASWLTRYQHAARATTLEDMRRAVQSDSQYIKDIEIALNARIGQSWLYSQLREAEHSPAAAAIIRWARSKGYVPGQQELSLDRTIETLTRRLLREPRRDRLRLAAHLSRVLMHDRASADAELSQLLTNYH